MSYMFRDYNDRHPHSHRPTDTKTRSFFRTIMSDAHLASNSDSLVSRQLSLFLASSDATIHKYNPSTNSLVQIYSTADGNSISNLVAKGRGHTLVYTVAHTAHILKYSSGKITHSFESHDSPITSLALSNDGNLLASSSASAAHVHNLDLGTHTVLRGFPANVDTSTCVFHTHTHTRLLLAAGRRPVFG